MNSELLVWVMVLEGHQDHPIVIPNSLAPVPIPAPGKNLWVEINDRVDSEAAQVIMEDQAERQVRRVTIAEGGVFKIAGEEYKEGDDMMDVLCQVEAWDQKIPKYTQPPNYDNPYIPDRQE